MTPDSTVRKQKPQLFVKGQSGNPKGRPPGARNAALAALDKIGTDAAVEILKKTVEAAKNGNLGASEVILSRVWPARKGRLVALNLPTVKNIAGVNDAIAAVIAAMGAGQITPEEATAISGVIEAQRRAIETIDIDRRLLAIEAKLNGVASK